MPCIDVVLGTLQTDLPSGDSLELRLRAFDQSGAVLEDAKDLDVDSPEPRAAITSPVDGQLVYHTVEVTGTACDVDLESATLYAKPGSDPDSTDPWIVQASRDDSVYRGALFSWDTRHLSDGPCCLLLEVMDSAGKVARAGALVEVNNRVPTAEITFPVQNGGVPETCDIRGTASGENFSSYKLEYRSLEWATPGDWRVIVEGCTQPVTGGTLALWDTASLAQARYELRLTVYGISTMEIVETVSFFIDHTTPVALITSPEADGQYSGLLGVRGTASDEHFSHYTLSWASGAEPDNWHEIRRSSQPATDGPLGWWDTESLPEGAYRLKLESFDTAGNRACCILSLNIANPGEYTIVSIRCEPAGAMIAVGESVDFFTIGTDEQGRDHAIAASFEVLGDIGTVDVSGQFTAATAGIGAVRVTYDTFSFDAVVSVVNRVGDVVLEEDITWSLSGSPWVVDGWVVVPSGLKLTIEPGAVVKFARGGVYTEGELEMSGSTLTSLKDDSILGDTNADGSATMPQPGDWSCIFYTVAASASASGARLLYAGRDTDEVIAGGRRVASSASVVSQRQISAFASCEVSHSATSGIWITGTNAHLVGNTIDDFAEYGIYHFTGSPESSGTYNDNTFDCPGTKASCAINVFSVASACIEGNAMSNLQYGILAQTYSNPADMAVRSNSVDNCDLGIGVNASQVAGIEVSGNTLTDCLVGHLMSTTDGTQARSLIFGNTFTYSKPEDETYALMLGPGETDASVHENAISGYAIGIMSMADGQVSVHDNDISYEGDSEFSFGVMLTAAAVEPTAGRLAHVTGNRIEGFSFGVYIAHVQDQLNGNTEISGNSFVPPTDYEHSVAVFGSSQAPDSSIRIHSQPIADYAMGVSLSGFKTVTLEDCNLTSEVLFGGLVLLECDQIPGSSAVLRSNVLDSYGAGAMIRGYESTEITAQSVRINNYSGFGLSVQESRFGRCHIEGNTVTGASGSINVYDLEDAEVVGNAIHSCGQGISVQSKTAKIESNTLDGIAGSGISCISDEGGILRGNTVAGNGEVAYVFGIDLHGTGTVQGNQVSGFSIGLRGTNSIGAGFHIEDNTLTGISGGSRGMTLSNIAGTVLGNKVTGYSTGVEVSTSREDTRIIRNTIMDNAECGMRCFGPEYVDGTDNWWGHASGPAPYGNCNSVEGYVDVQPWVGQTVFYARVNGHDPHTQRRGDPVNMSTGNFMQAHTDLSFAGTGPRLTVARTYNSISPDESGEILDGPFGYGWTFTYSERVTDYMPDFEVDNKMVVGAEGDASRYLPDPAHPNLYHPEDEAGQGYATLSHNSDGTWTLAWPEGGHKVFDTQGSIQQVVDSNGNALTVGRDGSGRVTSVTDACGQSATFAYSGGRVSTITDPAGRTLSYHYDERGDLVRALDLNGGETAYTYDDHHRMLTITDPEGNVFVHNTYDSHGRVISQQDSQGHETVYDYDPAAHTSTFTDARGYSTTLRNNKRLYATVDTDAEGRSSAVEYDDAGNVTSRIDKLDNTTTYTYDGAGNMLTETDPLGNTTSSTYDERGNVLTTTDPLGNTTTRTYDSANNLLTETDPLGNATTYTYDSAGRLLTTTDSGGFTTANAYDARGNLISVTNPDGGVTVNVYDAANRKVSTTDPENNTTTYAYDVIGNLLSMTDPGGNVTTFAYDADGNEISATDPLGNTSSALYDGMGRKWRVIDPLGQSTTCTYDESGNLLSETDPLGYSVTNDYDSLGRLWRTTDARGNARTKTFDAQGKVLTETDALGNTTTNTYDAAGRVKTSTDPLGNTTSYEYDAAGRQISVTDPLGNVTTSSYDAAGRLVSSTDALGNATTFTNDERGNKVSQTDAQGNTTTYAYDPMGRQTATTDPSGRTVTFTYDKNGQKTATTDDLGCSTTFTYTPLGLIESAIDPAGSTVSYSYDASGMRTSMTDPRGEVTSYIYDASGRLISETDPLGNVTTYTYDACGRPVSRTDGEGTSTISYDPNGNVTHASYGSELSESATYDAENRPLLQQSSQGLGLAYSYDEIGRLQSISNGITTTSAAYDEAGRMTSKSLAYPEDEKTFTYRYSPSGQMLESEDSEGRLSTFTYSPSGRLVSKAYPNGLTTEYSYDPSGLTSTIEIARGEETLKTYQVSRDGRANVTSITEDSTSLTTYSYDSASRLTQEQSPWTGQITYTYDSGGNRLSKARQGQDPVTYSYDEASRLVSDSEGKTYSYNTRGELAQVSDGEDIRTYTWDEKGRLTSASENEQVVSTFLYDPANRMLASLKAETATLYAYDMQSDIQIATLDETLSLNCLFHSGADGLISSTSGGDTSYFSYNPHSDASLLTDEDAQVTAELHYDAWGNPSEPTEEPNAYLGKHQRRTMPDIGLIKMGARFYDPQTGRFISKDPAKGHDDIPISHNPYVYAGDDPVNLKDLSGLDAYSDGLRKKAQELQYLGNDLEQQGLHDLAQTNWENARRLFRLANEHDAKVVNSTPSSQSSSSPRSCPFMNTTDLYAGPVVAQYSPNASLVKDKGYHEFKYVIKPIIDYWDKCVKGEPWYLRHLPTSVGRLARAIGYWVPNAIPMGETAVLIIVNHERLYNRDNYLVIVSEWNWWAKSTESFIWFASKLTEMCCGLLTIKTSI